MKKQYTKKQITEAIAYWKEQLNEDISYSGNIYNLIDEIKDVLVSLSDYVNTLEQQADKSNDAQIKNTAQNISLMRDELNRFFGL